VVTEPLAGYPGFREWVAAKRRPAPEAAPPAESMNRAGAWNVSALSSRPPAVTPEAASDLDQQFANLFHSAEAPLPPAPPEFATPAAQEPEERTLSMPAAQGPAPASTPVDRTELMPGNVARTRSLELPPEPPVTESKWEEIKDEPGTPERISPGSGPGEFTRLFSPAPAISPQPHAGQPGAPAAPPPQAAGPGPVNSGFPNPGFTNPFSPHLPVGAPEPVVPAAVNSKPAPAPLPPPQKPSVDQPGATNPPGEFTQMFAAQSVPPAAELRPESRPAERPPGEKPPGEFTQMFSAQKASPPQGRPAVPPGGPGEFTQLFSAQAASKNPPAPPEPGPAAGAAPGEFTRFVSAHQPVPQPRIEPQPPPPGNPARANSPGEFTRMLQAQAAPPAKSPAWPGGPGSMGPQQPVWPPHPGPGTPGASGGRPPGHGQPGEFTRFFEAPIGPMPQSPVLQEPVRPVTPSGTNPVGEFTQIFGPQSGLSGPSQAGQQNPSVPVAPQAPASVPMGSSPAVPSPAAPAPAAPQASAAPPITPSPFAMPFAPPAANIPPVSATGGSATHGFAVPAAGGSAIPPGTFPPPAAPPVLDKPAPSEVKPPGDFTQKFAAPAQLTLGQGQPREDTFSAAPSRFVRLKPYVPLILGMLVLVLIAAAVIVILANRK
jgi:hypothetical protein